MVVSGKGQEGLHHIPAIWCQGCGCSCWRSVADFCMNLSTPAQFTWLVTKPTGVWEATWSSGGRVAHKNPVRCTEHLLRLRLTGGAKELRGREGHRCGPSQCWGADGL